MPFKKPTLTELIETSEADVAAGFGLPALLPESALSVLARTLAGLAYSLHGHIAYASDQILPDTATAENIARWAAIFGINRKPATPATGTALVTGTEGTSLLDGTKLRRNDGLEFEIDGTQVIPFGGGGELSATIRGALGTAEENSPVATLLTFTSALEGVATTAAVEAPGLTGGAAIESDAALLDRLLTRLQNTPQGGAAADYLIWAKEIAGVTRAWVLPLHLGVGTVGVTFAVDDDPDGPIPSTEKVAEVQAYLDDPSRKPVCATPTAFAPVERLISFTLTIEPDDATVKAAVEANLTELINREATPGATLRLTHIAEAISTTPGEIDHTISFPSGDIVLTTSQLGVFDGVTWL